MIKDDELSRGPANKVHDEEDDFQFLSEPGHMTRRLHQISVSLFLDLVKDFDLTPIQYGALSAVNRHPAYDQRQIAQLLAVDRTTINAVSSRLAERGLLVRKSVGRRINLSLTQEGQRVLDAAAKMVSLHSDQFLSPLTLPQREQFMNLL